MRWPRWIHDALRLGPHEVQAVHPGLPESERRLLRRASEQPDEAVQLLIQRLARTESRAAHRGRWGIPVLAMAAVATALWVMARQPTPAEYGTLTIESGVPIALMQADATPLGPSITMRGLATVQVLQADEHGTVVRIDRGSMHFEVDPEGPFRALTVVAADARVRVTGTAFVVHRLWDSVHVDVLRGSVQIDRDESIYTVTAGDSWSHEAEPARPPQTGPVVAVAPPVEVPDGVVDAPTTPATPSIARQTPAPQQVDALPQTPEAAYAQVLDAADAGESPASVARSLDALLRRWPDSPLVPEATALRLEIAVDLEPAPVVFADAMDWLDAWPGHPRRLAMLELAATLARDRMRDCTQAKPLYSTLAAEAPSSRTAVFDALAGLCALELGARQEAREALSAAAERGLPSPLAQDVAQALEVLGEAPR